MLRLVAKAENNISHISFMIFEAMWLQKIIDFSIDFFMNFNGFWMDSGIKNDIKKL